MNMHLQVHVNEAKTIHILSMARNHPLSEIHIFISKARNHRFKQNTYIYKQVEKPPSKQNNIYS